MNKEHFDGVINWITSGELKSHYIAETKEKISEEAAERNNLRMLPLGTFVIAIYGLEATGVRATGSITTQISTISQACMAFLPKSEVANEFLYSWYMKHGNIIGLRYAQGTKQQNLSYDILDKFQISYPKGKEQEKLIHFVSIIDRRIAVQNKIIEDLRQLKSALTDKLINDFVKNVPIVAFKQLYRTAGEGGTPDTCKREYYDNGTIPFIKIDDLTNKYLSHNKDYITELGLSKSSAWIVPANSVIFSNGATIGATSINEFDVATKQGILGIVPKEGVDVEYLYYLMTSLYFRREINRIVTHGTMATAYLKDINMILVPLPTIEEQIKAIGILSSISRKEEIEVHMLQLLQVQKQFLLQQMFI